MPLATLREKLRETGRTEPTAPGERETTKQRATPVGKAPETSTLAAIAQARPELFPLKIHASYRGAAIEATINADGAIEYNGKIYKSPSAAANAARLDYGFGGAVRVRTNGWTWWHFADADGGVKMLDVLRYEGPAGA